MSETCAFHWSEWNSWHVAWMRPFSLVIVSSSVAAVNEATKAMLLERQKEYKLAALRAKKEGDMEQAKLYFRTSKVSSVTLTNILKHLLCKTSSSVIQVKFCFNKKQLTFWWTDPKKNCKYSLFFLKHVL